MWIASLAAIAIVTQDPAPLRASPRDSAPQQAQLWQGDALEIRGERLDYLQVYDHRRERAGYVLASQVRTTSATAAEAPELLSVLRFVRDTPGAESLGIAYAAAYLKAVPAAAMTAEPLEALGTMADRLAARASGRAGAAPTAGAAESRLSAHLEGVAQYGVKMVSLEQDGVVQVCYDGEAFRQVLAMPTATPEQRARAALGLTRHECVDPQLGPLQRLQWDQWRAGVLARADSPQLPPTLRNRLRLREAGVWAALAHALSRRAEASAVEVQAAGQKAVQALAAVVPADLTDGDQADYTQAALRVGPRAGRRSPPPRPLAAWPCGPSPASLARPACCWWTLRRPAVRRCCAAAPMARSGPRRLSPGRMARPWPWPCSRWPPGASSGSSSGMPRAKAAGGWTCCRRPPVPTASAMPSSPAGCRATAACWPCARPGWTGAPSAASR